MTTRRYLFLTAVAALSLAPVRIDLLAPDPYAFLLVANVGVGAVDNHFSRRWELFLFADARRPDIIMAIAYDNDGVWFGVNPSCRGLAKCRIILKTE